MKKSLLYTAALSAILLGASATSALAQSTRGPSSGVAKTCKVGLNGNTLEVTGNGGTCGKGS